MATATATATAEAEATGGLAHRWPNGGGPGLKSDLDRLCRSLGQLNPRKAALLVAFAHGLLENDPRTAFVEAMRAVGYERA